MLVSPSMSSLLPLSELERLRWFVDGVCAALTSPDSGCGSCFNWSSTQTNTEADEVGPKSSI